MPADVVHDITAHEGTAASATRLAPGNRRPYRRVLRFRREDLPSYMPWEVFMQ